MIKGNLKKMTVSLDEVVSYRLPIGDSGIDLNPRIGQPISLRYAGLIHCIKCGRETKKSFGQGFCFPCFRSAPEASECILRPELCRAHEGEARDMAWAERHCLQEHVVYLAKSSAVKVGITRNTQIPTRWIDQGASEAVVFARTPNRYTAGMLEVALKAHLTDRTNWRRMLKNEICGEDLPAFKERLRGELTSDLSQYVDDDDAVWRIDYPVQVFPEKVKSIGFDKQPAIDGTLLGIKGQYLLLDDDRVLNIRKHQGYEVAVS